MKKRPLVTIPEDSLYREAALVSRRMGIPGVLTPEMLARAAAKAAAATKSDRFLRPLPPTPEKVNSTRKPEVPRLFKYAVNIRSRAALEPPYAGIVTVKAETPEEARKAAIDKIIAGNNAFKRRRDEMFWVINSVTEVGDAN